MSPSIDLMEYLRLAISSGAFKGIEIDLLKETLSSWMERPGQPYTVLELRDGKTLAAFAIISRMQGRDTTLDIRYICVDGDYRSTAGSARMIEMIEEEALRIIPRPLLQLELSGVKAASLGEISLQEKGYNLIGHIRDFYAEGNDYFLYTKYLCPANDGNGPVRPSSFQLE